MPKIKIRETTYTITNAQNVKNLRLEKGQILGKVQCPAELSAHHVIEAMRGGIPNLEISERIVEVGSDDVADEDAAVEPTQVADAGKGKGKSK